ncbi:DUF2029 domain-containing protein [Nocardia abscessus]|uniref:glycosyltransferase family 87 protein n=1 Tax=Nocardia abscessus TaxID=120957 RepID=UPI00189544EB|nr:glycosyltransferase family 87 protein [Nocardia abscessus]MBF6341377.1 DUF2029 domain-containing protein [Nocardia abscessus]
MSFRQFERRTAPTAAQVIRVILWPFAVLTVADRVFIKAAIGYVTDDFQPVYEASKAFLNHLPVYGEDLNFVDPHYLYPPSGTLLIAPLAIIDLPESRWLFIILNAAAIITAWHLLLALFDFSLSSIAAPVLLGAMFLSESVTNTLVFTNINGCLLLAEVLFIRWLLQGRDLRAGTALGLMIAVKITPGVLLLIPLARRQWKVSVTALGVPVLLTCVAWPLSADPEAFITNTLRYLSKPRDYFNSSIGGTALYYGVADWLTLLLQIAMATLVAITLWILYRHYLNDDLFFVCTSSGVLLAASWLIGSLGQMYYSMFLLPFLMTVVLRNSVLRNWPAWLAIYGFMSYEKWLLDRWPSLGRDLEYLRVPLGWSLLLIVTFCVLGDRYLNARRKGQLHSGIPIESVESSSRAETQQVGT